MWQKPSVSYDPERIMVISQKKIGEITDWEWELDRVAQHEFNELICRRLESMELGRHPMRAAVKGIVDVISRGNLLDVIVRLTQDSHGHTRSDIYLSGCRLCISRLDTAVELRQSGRKMMRDWLMWNGFGDIPAFDALLSGAYIPIYLIMKRKIRFEPPYWHDTRSSKEAGESFGQLFWHAYTHKSALVRGLDGEKRERLSVSDGKNGHDLLALIGDKTYGVFPVSGVFQHFVRDNKDIDWARMYASYGIPVPQLGLENA